MRKILVVGHGATSTGFSRVVNEIVRALHTHYEVHHFSPYYLGPDRRFPWHFYPNRRHGDVYGFEEVNHLVQVIRPDLLLLVDDFTLAPLYLKIARERQPGMRFILYTPAGGQAIEPALVADLAHLDCLVLYTQTAKDAFDEAFVHAQSLGLCRRSPVITVIPHGVDTTMFRPEIGRVAGEIDRSEIKRKIFGNADTDFVVLNANRNQPRKRIDVTIGGFSRFSRNKPLGVKLCLHMAVGTGRSNVVRIARQFGIESRLLFPPTKDLHPALTDQELNFLYCACDVGLNTAWDEGWGLLAFEHGATAAAQVMPDVRVLNELWSDHAVFMAREAWSESGSGRLDDEKAEIAVAEALEELYGNYHFLAKKSWSAFDNARNPRYRWQNIGAQWRELFLNFVETK